MRSPISHIIVFLLIGFTQATDPIENDGPIVKTPQGSLQGVIQESRDGKPYYVFRGIPYAEFPGRFEVATKHATWDGIRSAVEYGSVCPQFDLLNPDNLEVYFGEEMCLFLNVFTPTLDANASLPVMFWIHGGAYAIGSGNGFDGKYFVDENVIVVSINYRLGPLGFLSFGEDSKSMDNIGLKDQLLALRWVSKNIQAFGGDTSKVTIAGFSAGAASVHLHILSGQSTGLFRAAISQSGTAVAYWAMQQNPRENAVKLSSALDCPIPATPTSSLEDTLSCLKSKSTKELTLAQWKLKEWLIYPIVIFGPVIEPKGDDSFITEKPEVILQNGRHNKVNWITGFTEDEGATWDIPLILNQTLTDTLENEWEQKAPFMLGYENLPKSEQELISRKIRNHYFEHYEVEEMTWSSLRNMLTDRYFLEPLVQSILLQSQHSGRIFPYIFGFSGDFSVVHTLYNVEGDHGIAHGDDLQYLFPGGGGAGAPDYSGDTPMEIVEFSRKFVKLWACFIEKTVPCRTWQNEKIEWKSYNNNKDKSPKAPIQFYELAVETGIWDEDFPSRIKVWSEVFSKSKFVKTEL